MPSTPTNACLVCSKHRGETAIPSGVIFENELIYISHARRHNEGNDQYLGYVFVEPKRHVPKLADLTEEEARAVGLYTSRVAKALMCTEGVEHVYAFVRGDCVPRVHVLGRYPGAPREHHGLRVDEVN